MVDLDTKHGRPAKSFGSVLQEIEDVQEVTLLASPDQKAIVAVCPAIQGRVLTSTATGLDGPSFGWVNTDLIRSRQVQRHFNAYGGEDRIWLGPEGGQFSIFFAPGSPFDVEHWITPAPLDKDPFEVTHRSTSSVGLRSRFELLNHSGSRFSVQLDREVILLDPEHLRATLPLSAHTQIEMVGFESRNCLTNIGAESWKEETGLLSLWILGQFAASKEAMIVIPIRPGTEHELGPKVTSDYFGDVPVNRLKPTESTIFLKADGAYRSKLGVSPARSQGVVGSYDADSKVLTIVQYTTHDSNTRYVNSKWSLQDDPYDGDVANVYNDGPMADGSPGLGDFYELESSSPAAALGPGESIQHLHRTVHLVGDQAELDAIARRVLGVGLSEIQTSLP